MHVWLIQTGEPLPVDGEAPRLLRTGMMAQQLVRLGNDVTWWCSTFNHWTKTHRYPKTTVLELQSGYRLHMLHSPGYERNVSLARILDHRYLAECFEHEIQRVARPDVILSSLPTVEMSEIATRFGRKHGIPVIVDVRDLWPDAFLNFVPPFLRPLGKLFLGGLFHQAKRALENSSSIVGVSEGYLQWGLKLAGRDRRATDAVFPLSYQRTSPSSADLQAAASRLVSLGVDPRRVVCWFIGTFGQTYDVGTVIEAARRLHARNDHRVQFVLSGEGGQLEQCREQAKGLDNVIFTAWLNSTEIEWMMSAAGVGLAAYVVDAPQGLPNKVFEYLSAGLPILSSLGAEAEELLSANHCGFSYAPGNPDDLLRKLLPLVDDPVLLATMKGAAQRAFDEKFSAERVYGEYLQFVQRLATSSAPRAHAGGATA